MGTNCAKSTSGSRSSSAEVSDIFMKELYQKPSNGEYRFQIKLLNLCLSSKSNSIYEVTFEFNEKQRVLFAQEDMIANGKLKQWHNAKKFQLKLTERELKYYELSIKVYSREKKQVQSLALKLYQLCRGPIHHDHLLPQIKSRVIFDIQINQYIDVSLTCTSLQILRKQNEIKSDSLQISLDLISNSRKHNLTEEKMHCLNDKIIFSKTVLSKQLKESSLRLVVWEKYYDTVKIYGQVYIPYEKFVNLCSSFITERRNNINFIKRNLPWSERLKKQKQIHKKMPTIEDEEQQMINFTLTWQSTETYAEQLEGVICSENGIGTVSPHLLTGQGGYSVFAKPQNHQLNYKQLACLLKQYKQLTSNKSIINMHKKMLIKTYNSLTKIHQFNFQEQNQTIDYQLVLLDLLEHITLLIERGEDYMNQNIWKVFGVIIRRPELSIRYLHAIDNINDKKKIALKFYKFLCSTLSMVVRSTAIGLTFKELKYSQKFIAYCYFRYPYLQQKFLNGIYKKNDPLLSPQKLAELGAFTGVKSPSKSMVFDWEANLFNFIRRQPEYIEVHEKLQEAIESLPGWLNMLFNHQDEELYFGGLSEFLNEAEVTLNYQNKIMWEYFPGYGNFLSRFEAEMKTNQPIGFTQFFREFAVKLMRNEKLLNNFIKILFQKTFLYQTYSVMRCIDIIRSCFDVIAEKNNRRIPTNFNHALFSRGIISILQINHSTLIVKTLNILYLHYQMLSLECQNGIDSFVLGLKFYSLFFHWFHIARKMFMCLLLRRIIPKYTMYEKQWKKLQNSQNQRNFNEQIIENLQKLKNVQLKVLEKKKQQKFVEIQLKLPKLQDQYFVRMKRKLVNMKRDKVWQKSHHSIFNQTAMTSSAISKNSGQYQFRQRKWSNSVSQQSEEQFSNQFSHYFWIAIHEFEQIKASKINLDETVKQMIRMFSSKKKIDQKQ